MNALSTLFNWALDARPGTPAPPTADLDLQPLSAPIQKDIIALALQALGQLGLSKMPLGERQPAGVGPALLGAAILARENHHQVVEILRHLPQKANGMDQLARYALLEKTWAHLSDEMRCTLLDASPIHGLFFHPPAHKRAHFMQMAHDWRQDPALRQALIHGLATPHLAFLDLAWRKSLLEHLRFSDAQGLEFVLDVFETMLNWHWRIWAQALAAAIEQEDARSEVDSTLLELWGILGKIARATPECLAHRSHLDLREPPLPAVMEVLNL